jgi:hypothetical protein
MDFTAIVFVPTLVACVLAGFVLAMFGSHYYLTVLQTTAAGARRVTWLVEPILDHFWKMFYLGWLLALWLGPAWLLGQALARAKAAPWLGYAVPLAVLWVCYPVSQMSSLTGSSIWLPLHTAVFRRLVRRPGTFLGFLALSGITLGAAAVGFWGAFLAPSLGWLFAGVPLFVISGLIFARLIGRLSFALAYTRPVFSSKRKKRSPRPLKSTAQPTDPDDADARNQGPEELFVQPSDLPPITTPDEGPLTGYDVTFDQRPVRRVKRVRAEAIPAVPEVQPSAPRPAQDEDDCTPYGVGQAEVVREEPTHRVVCEPSADEMRLLNRDDAPEPPTRVWTWEVLTFLSDGSTIQVVVMLSGMCGVLGGLVRLARSLSPVSGDS